MLKDSDSKANNYQTILKRFALISASVFLLLLIVLYSPHADSFSIRSDLFSVFIISALISIFIFALGVVITRIHLFPHTLKKQPAIDTNFDIEQEQNHSREYNDWYNHDVVNPASPIHQIIQRSLHHED